jgi:cell wall-associated NlpC family hydrolase
VFFETYAFGASHVGIYVGNGNFVHASASRGVRVDSLGDGYYSSRFLGARREAI